MNEKDADKSNDRTAEKLTEAVRDSYEAAMESTAAMQETNARLARSFFEGSVETFEAQLELNRRSVQRMTELAREQREAFRRLSLQSFDAYDGFVDSLFSYYKEVSEESEEPGKGD